MDRRPPPSATGPAFGLEMAVNIEKVLSAQHAKSGVIRGGWKLGVHVRPGPGEGPSSHSTQTPARRASRGQPAEGTVKVISSQMPVTYWKEALSPVVLSQETGHKAQSGADQTPLWDCARALQTPRCCTVNGVEAANR